MNENESPKRMTSRLTDAVTGLIGLTMVSVFVVGLSHGISTGFAGFFGGLPFAVITVLVLAIIAYDVWDECLRRKGDD